MSSADWGDKDDPEDAPALAALVELGRQSATPHTRAELDRGLEVVRALLAVDRAQRRVVRRRVLIGATALACGVVALKIAWMSSPAAPELDPPVTIARIEGGNLRDGGYLSPSGRAGVKVVFSEGSTFELMPGTRGRLRSVDDAGAHLAVEQGTASFKVTRSHQHRWLVDAGPFVVTVKGTVFTVSWDPSNERFELRLRRGHVVVRGPVVSGGIALRAGQQLVVNLPRAETVIREDEAGGEEEDGPGERPNDVAGAAPAAVRPNAPSPAPRDGAVSHPGGRRPSAAPPAPTALTRTKRTGRWAADLAAGQWDRILADVDRDGVDATLDSAASEDLFALADAARYRRRADLARAALLAQRRRFPQAARSIDALFLLGRAEELRDQGTRAQAIEWYDEYLARAPTGAFAAEALGRKMILASEQGGPAAARAIASEYLLRFPSGSYAGSARALARAP